MVSFQGTVTICKWKVPRLHCVPGIKRTCFFAKWLGIYCHPIPGVSFNTMATDSLNTFTNSEKVVPNPNSEPAHHNCCPLLQYLPASGTRFEIMFSPNDPKNTRRRRIRTSIENLRNGSETVHMAHVDFSFFRVQ